MKRRSRAGGEATKGRRRKTPEPKRRNAPKAVAPSNSPPTGKEDEFAQLARELGEAQERQTATTEVLQVINSSCGDLQPVFQTMLAKAVRLCQATFGVLWLAEEHRFRSVALHNLPPAFAAARQREPVVYFGPKSGTGRLIEKKQIFKIDDLTKDPGYIERDPRIMPLVELGGARTALFAPLLKENHVIGSLVLYRQEVRPFADKQIELVKNFAAQAVIAIENARLLNELRQSLEQQIATGEILSSMSGSIADTKPVFDAIVRNLLRLFGTRFAVIMLLQNGMIYLSAVAGEQGFERLADLFPRPLSDDTISGRAMLLKEPFQFAPLVDNPAVPPFGQQNAREFGYNSIVFLRP
jgi:two-component system NtrC family sensor kinase